MKSLPLFLWILFYMTLGWVLCISLMKIYIGLIFFLILLGSFLFGKAGIKKLKKDSTLSLPNLALEKEIHTVWRHFHLKDCQRPHQKPEIEIPKIWIRSPGFGNSIFFRISRHEYIMDESTLWMQSTPERLQTWSHLFIDTQKKNWLSDFFKKWVFGLLVYKIIPKLPQNTLSRWISAPLYEFFAFVSQSQRSIFLEDPIEILGLTDFHKSNRKFP